MLESGRRVLVPLLAMLMCGLGVLLRLLVLAELMVMGGLVVMMGGGMVMRGCLQMMLAGRGLGFCHGAVPSDRIEKRIRYSLVAVKFGVTPLAARTARAWKEADFRFPSPIS